MSQANRSGCALRCARSHQSFVVRRSCAG
uniref:Uncharacterized protein n=1 Tax=Arundo donax TaxID=35708 RepID=A0A0A9KRH8_ARUDO